MSDKDLITRNGTDLQTSLEGIWRDTEWLNAQVPAGLRKAIGAIQSIENPAEREKQFQAFVLGQLMDVRSAMTNEDSKFAHLVAGAESIVKTLQNLNPLERRLERIEQIVDGMGELMENRFAELRQLVESILPRAQHPVEAESTHVKEEKDDDAVYDTGEAWVNRVDAIHHGECHRCHTMFFGDFDPYECSHCGAGGPNPKLLKAVEGMGWMVSEEPKEAIPEDVQAEEARRRSIGSAWAK